MLVVEGGTLLADGGFHRVHVGLRTVKGCVRVGDWAIEQRLAKSIVVVLAVHFQVTLSVTIFPLSRWLLQKPSLAPMLRSMTKSVAIQPCSAPHR